MAYRAAFTNSSVLVTGVYDLVVQRVTCMAIANDSLSAQMPLTCSAPPRPLLTTTWATGASLSDLVTS